MIVIADLLNNVSDVDLPLGNNLIPRDHVCEPLIGWQPAYKSGVTLHICATVPIFGETFSDCPLWLFGSLVVAMFWRRFPHTLCFLCRTKDRANEARSWVMCRLLVTSQYLKLSTPLPRVNIVFIFSVPRGAAGGDLWEQSPGRRSRL